MKKKHLPFKFSLNELKGGTIEGGFQLISAHKLTNLIGGVNEPTNTNCNGANCVPGCGQTQINAGSACVNTNCGSK